MVNCDQRAFLPEAHHFHKKRVEGSTFEVATAMYQMMAATPL
jgi:hypothetical protein